jgi:hypothetical protein
MIEKTWRIELPKLQPSQLYICNEKLATVQNEWNEAALFPLPVKWLDRCWMLTDGHTRALAAWRRGLTTVCVYADTDDLDWEAYGICLNWCRAEGIYSVADLSGRIIGYEEYERLWIGRCAQMQSELEAGRQTA